MSKVEKSKMTQSINGVVTRAPKDETSDRGRFYWWKKADSPADMANEIASTIKFIEKHETARMEQLVESTRLYGNSTTYNLIGTGLAKASSSANATSSARISFNICSSAIDTLTAQVAKIKVVPTFITSGGVWGMQRKAEQLSKFIEGVFYEQNIHEKAVYQFRDAACWGDGILHVYRDDKDRAAVERVLPHELKVDLVESTVGKPRQLHRIKVADRAVVLDMFPDHEEAIMSATPVAYQDVGGSGTAADLITIAESWHLKSGEDTDDGIHVITLPDAGVTLFQEKWEKEYFPFVVLPYSKRLLGYWSQGACERLQNIQMEINRLMILVQRSMWMGGSFKILVENGSKVVSQHLNNEVGAIIHYQGTPPQYITPPMIQQDVYPYIDSLIAKGYQQEGISQLSANNLKPLGINSGKALRAYDQIAEDRHLFVSQQIENVRLEVARQMIEVVKDVAKEKGGYKIKFPSTNFVESIDWKDIKLKEDEYWLKAFPTSSLPEEPAAKLETVQEYMQAGLVSPRAGRRLLAMPDVEMSDKLANAAEELVCKTVEDILYDGETDLRPDGSWDLNLAKSICLQYYNYALLNDCPEDRMQMLRDFMAYIDDELGLTAPPPMPGAGAPMANPQATPTSDLIPNVAAAGVA